jgi:hypothetical protein
MKINLSEIPGYIEAVEQENTNRNDAFLDLLTKILPCVHIRQMTPEDFVILDGLGSSILKGETPTPRDLTQFLWILSPERDKRFHFIRARWHGRKCRVFDYAGNANRFKTFKTALAALKSYLEKTFQDAPGESGGAQIPYAGWPFHMTNLIASTYGWSHSEIMKTPLRRLYQYLRCIRRDNDPDCIFFNPSDSIRNRYTRMQRQGKTTN